MSDDVTPPPVADEPPPVKKRHTNAIIVGSAVLAVAGAAAVGLLIANGKHDDSKATKPAATTVKASASSSLADRMRNWGTSGGSETLTTLVTDLSAVQKASDPVDLDGLRDSCSTLTADVEAAQEEDPVPDAATDKRWSLALEHLGNSAAACTTGAVGGDQTQFDLMASEMDIGTKHLNAVNKRVDEIMGT